MFDLCGRQCLGEHVGDHVFCGTIHKAKGAPLNHPMDEVIAHIDVLGASMVLVVLRERNGGLVVREKGGGLRDGAKKLRQKASQPECLLHAMRGCNVFTLSGGK
jgi:hypothetical protein